MIGMNENFEKVDEQLQKAVKQFYDGIDVPEPSGWKEVHVQLQKRRKRKRWIRRTKISLAFVAVSLITTIFVTPNIPVTYAHVSSLFREIKENVIQIFFQKPNEQQENTEAKTLPPADTVASGPNQTVPEMLTLEQAKKKLAFSILLPAYVPESYRLDRIRGFKEPNNQYRNIYLEYINDDGDIIKLSQRIIDDGAGTMKVDVHENAGTIKDTLINGNPGVLVILPEGDTDIEWISKDEIKISISGSLTEDEILKMAKSMQ